MIEKFSEAQEAVQAARQQAADNSNLAEQDLTLTDEIVVEKH